MEHELINGNLQAADLNNAWNEEFYRLFGKKLQSKKDGYLQDVHWSSGLFGYFPTYTIGNLIAAQVAKKIDNDTAVFSKDFDKNSIPVIKDWLRKNFYIHGNRCCTEDFVKKVTSESLSPDALIEDLKRRYC